MDKTKYFEYIQKSYSLRELKDHWDTDIIINQIISTYRFPASKFKGLYIEKEFNIKLFKSYFSDKYLLLSGIEVFNTLNIITDDELNGYKSEFGVDIIYSDQENIKPKEFYKRIKDIYGVSVEEFLKISKEGDNKNV